jgi:rhombotail lipoprotein
VNSRLPQPLRRWTRVLAGCGIALALGACAQMDNGNQQHQVASMLSFLFPKAQEQAAATGLPGQVSVIKVPFRIGVAFVPDTSGPQHRLAETDRLKLAAQVRDAFSAYPFVQAIETVPSMYLEPGGSFENLDRVASLLRLDVIALISFDQVQHADANKLSLLYWTGVGAYLVKGDEFDILTAVDTSVFDIRSRRLLMHATGMSKLKGSATLVGFNADAREARAKGLTEAVGEMVHNLHQEVASFRDRARQDPLIRLELPAGYQPGVAPAPAKAASAG